MSRVVALCEGGPLDGQAFSVEEGQPLESREAVAGVLYTPARDIELTDDLAALFPWADHGRAVVYEVTGG